MHEFDRATGKPVDVQYSTSPARPRSPSRVRIASPDDPEDLRAASRALARLSGRGWSFFGSRYYFSEEHWTCQAVADLWERAPDPEALAFCLRWHEYQRRLQHEERRLALRRRRLVRVRSVRHAARHPGLEPW